MTFCDTCFIIDLLHNHENAINLVYQYPDLMISTIAVAEFLYGIQHYSIRKKEVAIGFINKFEHIPFNTTTAHIFARLYQEMKDQGLSLSILDAMIAATAIEHQKPLITRDNALMKAKNLHVISY